MTFTSITGYDDFQREETNDVDGQPNSVQENINETDIETFSQELRLSGQTDKMLWIGGLYYAQDDLEEFYNFFMADSVFGDGSAAWDLGNAFAFFPIRRLHTKYEQETESYAIFGHIEYNLSENMRLTVGARYTEEERDWSGCTFDAGDGGLAAFWNASPFSPTLQAGDCATLDDLPNSPNFIGNVAGTPDVNNAWHVLDFDISTEKWMGKIGLDYAFTDDILGYAMISTGFKSGGFNGNNSNTAAQLVPYEPEEVTSYELGLKSTLLDGTMQLNAAAFYYDYEDKQESERAITPVGAIGGTGNVPESEIYGAELDLQWAPTDGLLLQTGVAYLDSEIKKWVTPVSGDYNLGTGQPENVVFVDASGGALPQTPEWSVMALASYEWSITDGLMMQVAADVNYTDDQPDPVRVANSLESWTLYNARISVADVNNQWRLMLWGRNLGDEYYYAAAFNGPNGGYMRTAGMPRTYGLRFDYNF